jgi:hypothetical protein
LKVDLRYGRLDDSSDFGILETSLREVRKAIAKG